MLVIRVPCKKALGLWGLPYQKFDNNNNNNNNASSADSATKMSIHAVGNNDFPM